MPQVTSRRFIPTGISGNLWREIRGRGLLQPGGDVNLAAWQRLRVAPSSMRSSGTRRRCIGPLPNPPPNRSPHRGYSRWDPQIPQNRCARNDASHRTPMSESQRRFEDQHYQGNWWDRSEYPSSAFQAKVLSPPFVVARRAAGDRNWRQSLSTDAALLSGSCVRSFRLPPWLA